MDKVFAAALGLLTRREHSAYELTQKLARKEYSKSEIQAAIAKCQDLELQSDKRFAESLLRLRIRQGYGPQKIRQDLQNVQIERDLIDSLFEQEKENWIKYATDAWEKKFKSSNHQTYADIQKQKQFLFYRGFSMETISKVFDLIT